MPGERHVSLSCRWLVGNIQRCSGSNIMQRSAIMKRQGSKAVATAGGSVSLGTVREVLSRWGGENEGTSPASYILSYEVLCMGRAKMLAILAHEYPEWMKSMTSAKSMFPLSTLHPQLDTPGTEPSDSLASPRQAWGLEGERSITNDLPS